MIAKHLTDQDRLDIVVARNQGETTSALAARYGLHIRVCSALLKALGAKPIAKPGPNYVHLPAPSADVQANIIGLFHEKVPMTVIARRLGISEHAVRRVVVPLRAVKPPRVRSGLTDAECRRLNETDAEYMRRQPAITAVSSMGGNWV